MLERDENGVLHASQVASDTALGSRMKIVFAQSYAVSIFIAGEADRAIQVCREYCDKEGLCVTVTPTTYCYTGGEEAGVIVGLINYPRFPAKPDFIWMRALGLAALLCERLEQQSYTVQDSNWALWVSHRAADALKLIGSTIPDTVGTVMLHELIRL